MHMYYTYCLLLFFYTQVILTRLRNGLYCVEWDVKLYYTIPYKSYYSASFYYFYYYK